MSRIKEYAIMKVFAFIFGVKISEYHAFLIRGIRVIPCHTIKLLLVIRSEIFVAMH